MDLLDNIENEYGEDAKPNVVSVLMAVEIAYTDNDGDRSTHVAMEYSGRPVERAGLYHYLGQALGVKG